MADPRPIKLVVTNQAALRRLYGRGVSRVQAALRDLRQADRRRGLDTRIVRLDVTADMARYGAKRVARHLDERAVKRAIDTLWKALDPHYLVLLGSPDVVPHQTLTEGIDTTDDPAVPSDLPYACDAPYSDDARDFVEPTRLVGRIPGITGHKTPTALVAAIRCATHWRPRSRRHYDNPLAVSVKIWKKATTLSLQDVFGSARGLQLVTPKNFRWTQRQISRRAHYLNCHGVDGEGVFEGQDGDLYPTAHESMYVARKIREGTVAAAACCYGAQLYDPARAGSKEPIVNAYLRYGCYAYFGSSTSVWGNPFVSELGDLLCQIFFRHIRRGVSSGRAVLEARREYLRTHSPAQPIDLLTVAQFGLFGDPAVHPILPSGLTSSNSGPVSSRVHEEFVRREVARRAPDPAIPMLELRAPDTFQENPRARIHGSVTRALHSEVQNVGGAAGKIQTYTLVPRAGPEKGGTTHSVHTVSSEVGKDARGRTRRVLVVAQARGQKLLSLRVLHTKG
jgi:hypothetical protein